jgi:hypothetical protein
VKYIKHEHEHEGDREHYRKIIRFLDNTLKRPLIELLPETIDKDNYKDKKNVVETVLGIVNELFTTIF